MCSLCSSVDWIRLWLLGLTLSFSVSLVFVVLCIFNLFCYILYLSVSWAWWNWPLMWLKWAEPGGIGPWCGWLTIELQCSDSSLIHKIVSEITYNMSSGTSNRLYHTVLMSRWITLFNMSPSVPTCALSCRHRWSVCVSMTWCSVFCGL